MKSQMILKPSLIISKTTIKLHLRLILTVTKSLHLKPQIFR